MHMYMNDDGDDDAERKINIKKIESRVASWKKCETRVHSSTTSALSLFLDGTCTHQLNCIIVPFISALI